jgi:hypothetical protein
MPAFKKQKLKKTMSKKARGQGMTEYIIIVALIAIAAIPAAFASSAASMASTERGKMSGAVWM